MKLRRPNLEAIYREVDHYIPKKENLQPPRIGISANRKDGLSCIAETYVQAVLKAGGAPVLIPVIRGIQFSFIILFVCACEDCFPKNKKTLHGIIHLINQPDILLCCICCMVLRQ